MEMTLRPSTSRDLDWLVELRADVLRDDLGRLGRYDPVRVRQRMRDAFVPACTQVILANGVDAGCITVRHEQEARWIEHFYLDPRFQGKGIGGRVLRSILGEEDPRPTRLNVLRGSPAQRLYERSGFVVDVQDEVDVFMTLRTSSR